MAEATRTGRGAANASTARSIAEETGLPAATTAKVLKVLQRSGLLSSTRGLCGGYALECDPTKTSIVTIDVRGYSDEIYVCVSWPEWFDLDKDLVRLQLTAHYPHFTLGTININGTESETTDFVWYTLMNTVRW